VALFIWTRCSFTGGVQRIFNYDNIQNTSITPDKALNNEINQSISNFYGGLSIAAATARTTRSATVTVGQQLGLQCSIWVGLLIWLVFLRRHVNK